MPTAGSEATRGLLLEMAMMMPSNNQMMVSGSPAFRAREMESMGAKAAAAAKNAELEAVVTKARESSDSKPGPSSPKARIALVQGQPAASAAQKYTVIAGKGAAELAGPMRRTGGHRCMMLCVGCTEIVQARCLRSRST